MDGYLPKPIRSQELDEVLDKYVTQKIRGSGPAEQTSPPAAIQEAVDARELLERIGDEREFLAELVNTFRDDFPKQLEAMTIALNDGNATQLALAAHSLKGALSNLAAQRAAGLAAGVESAGKSGDLPGAALGLRDLKPELARVVDALNALCQETVP
jgi:HPt (histidine-containing phosphotransfer) domain-containing protein